MKARTLDNHLSREEKIAKLAQVYHDLLAAVGPLLKDEVFRRGIREGLNKFLSNAWLSMNGGKHHTDYYSPAAGNAVRTSDKETRLVYEHMVPKNLFQSMFVQAAQEGTIHSAAEIRETLNACWYIALITASEEKKLLKNRMPEGWDGKNIFSRYEEAGLELIATAEPKQ